MRVSFQYVSDFNLLLLILGWHGSPGHQRKIKSHTAVEECPREVIFPVVRKQANKQLNKQFSSRWGGGDSWVIGALLVLTDDLQT
jgi:hypothetical protein